MLASLTPDILRTLPGNIEAEKLRRLHNKIETYYPDRGALRRELYPRHIEFFAAGVKHGERCALSANRVGKSEGLLCYELTCHATGRYPAWWPGRRFERPIDAWVAGKTSETTRDILQAILLGRTERDPNRAGETLGMGTGMIPLDCISTTLPKAGVPNAVGTVWVKHVSGKTSQITFKSYGKDRDSFEGTKKDIIGLDEEPPMDVYQECQMRLMSTNPNERGGMMIATFTPLEGYTEVVESFMHATDPDKFYIQIGWKDCPHITREEIERLSKKYLPHQLKARSEGQPDLGEGAVYPIDIEQLLVDDQPIPEHWRRGFGLDVGKTAAMWGALNPDTDILYLYKEYFSEEYNTVLHAAAIKGHSDQDMWIPGVCDPSSLQSNQVDGQKLFEIYSTMGLKLATADNAVEAGIHSVWTRMQTGRLKIFRSLQRFRGELGRYRRVKRETVFGIKSEIVKKNDHLCDATRYLVQSGIPLMITKPVTRPNSTMRDLNRGAMGANSWMG